MSQRADIFYHFCNDLYKQKMTVEETAELMTDLYEDLGYTEYDLLDKDGKYIGRNTEQAIHDLMRADNNKKNNN